MIAQTSHLKILVVDDYTLFREGLTELLAAEKDLEIVGQTGDSLTAVRLAASTRPHAVLLDIETPGHPICATIQRIRQVSPDTRVVIFTMPDDLCLIQAVLAVGAHGVLMKDASRQELVSAIRTVCYHGRSVLSVSPRSAAELATPVRNPLSPREIEVLELAAQALSNAQIAMQLFIAEGTVKRHLANVYAKLGAASRLDAVNKANAARLLPTPETKDRGNGRSSRPRPTTPAR